MFISQEDKFLVSGAADGLVKIWDFKSGEALIKLKPPNHSPSMELDIYSLTPMPNNPSLFVICNRSNTVFLANLQG